MATQLENYIKKLENHDWYYMYADSGIEYNKGRDEWFDIAALQDKLDPDYVIFNEHAPEGMKIDPASRKGAAK